jgi:hypothetical protein
LIAAIIILFAAILTLLGPHPQTPSLSINNSPAANITQRGQNIEGPIIIGPINGNITINPNPEYNRFNNNNTAANPNRPPKLYMLSPDKSSPQIEGASITWTADALDDNNDPISYKFFLNGKAMTGWSEMNTWIWSAAETSVGDNQIEVRVRDGNHAGPNSFDDRKTTGFAIHAPPSTLAPLTAPPTTPAFPASENKSPALDSPASLPKCPRSYIDSISPLNPEVGQDVRFAGHAELCPDGSKIRTYELSSDIDEDLNTEGHNMPSFNVKFKTSGDHNLTFKVIDYSNRQNSVYKKIKVNPTS